MNAVDITVPLDVPSSMKKEYLNNYMDITRDSGRLMLFAGDQKIEHLNDDFFGPQNHPDDANPEHLFRIASKSNIGVFAAQLGLIARYGSDYSEVPYLIKLNSKSHLVKNEQKDPLSKSLIDIKQVVEFKKNSGLKVLGVGYTVYVGSEFEAEMMREAAQIVYEAHLNGLVTVLWMYPRGKAVKNESDSHLIAGAAGVAACLGADFAKVNYPKMPEGAAETAAEAFKEAVLAAGKTGVVCAGGSCTNYEKFLNTLYEQIHISGAKGNATGRNIHQKSEAEAIKMTNAIYSITIENKSAEEALGMLGN
jgi:fructose-bisphosphate aldolase / 6-deoxy-5-ketofructose 1-phosphate synthase